MSPDARRALRRGQILTAARRIVSDHGLNALTISALEKNLTFSRGVITYHFKNKDEITLALFRSAIDEIDAATAAHARGHATLHERIRAVLEANVRGFIERVDASRVLFAFWSQLQTHPGAVQINAELWSTYRRRFARMLGVPGDAEPSAQTLAVLGIGLVIGIVTQAHFEADAVDVDAAIDGAAQLFEARLSSLCLDGAGPC